MQFLNTEAASHPDVFLGKMFSKYTANLQENSHAEVRFQ